MQVPLSRPWLDEREAEATRRVLASGWITQGPEVAAFEREFAEAVGAPYASACSSGTTALHLALLAAGVGPGDEVVTVSYSFIALRMPSCIAARRRFSSTSIQSHLISTPAASKK